MEDVRAVHAELRQVIEALGVAAVYHEGVTDENLPDFQHQLATLKRFKPKPESENPIDQLQATELERDMVKVGAPGQLAMAGKLTILPAEDHEAYSAGNVFAGGTYKVDEADQQRREEAAVRKLLQGPPVVVLLFGGAHDFSDEFKRLAPDVEYVRVTVKAWPE